MNDWLPSNVGIYAKKAVQCIWHIDSAFDVEVEDGQVKKTLVQGRDTNDYDEKIIGITAEAKMLCGYDVASDHRFFCGKPVPTNYVKTSPGGIQGARFFNLRDVPLAEPISTDAIAEALKQKTRVHHSSVGRLIG